MRNVLPFALLFAVACDPLGRERSVWFVHATDPHLFQQQKEDKAPAAQPSSRGAGTPAVGAPTPVAPPATAPPKVDEKEATRLRQLELNAQAFSSMLEEVAALRQEGSPPAFLVLTGDFGLDALSAEGGARASDVRRLADLLRSSAVRDIYFVLGNNDVKDEEAAGPNPELAATILGEVQRALGGRVVLHDLTSCYARPGVPFSACTQDIKDTRYSLVGFPSYSFKQPRKEQAAQVEKFARALRQLAGRRRRALVLSHVPEIEDPYHFARSRFTKLEDNVPDRDAAVPPHSAWNVSDEVLARWRSLAASPAVSAILAGHFHDSHAQIYLPPYHWAAKARRPELGKLFVAPPLAVKNQDLSPIQARGFALFELRPDRVRRTLYWYDARLDSFSPAASPAPPTSAAFGIALLIGLLALITLLLFLRREPAPAEAGLPGPRRRRGRGIETVARQALQGGAGAVALLFAVPLTIELLSRKEPDPKRVGVLALCLLAAAFIAAYGKDLAGRIRRIGPVELLDIQKTARELESVSTEIQNALKGIRGAPSLSGKAVRLSPSQQFHFEDGDRYLAFMRFSAAEPEGGAQQASHFELLDVIAQTAYARLEWLRAIRWFQCLEERSGGEYQPAEVSSFIAYSHLFYGLDLRPSEDARAESLAKAIERLRGLERSGQLGAHGFFWLAYAQYEQGQVYEAAQSNREALKRDPRMAPARYNLAISLLKLDEVEAAAEELDKIRTPVEGAAADEEMQNLIEEVEEQSLRERVRAAYDRIVALEEPPGSA